tara:strand:+ start:243 stop:635 length:393 start_codon:yes stop_codon:yes gene_type:complete
VFSYHLHLEILHQLLDILQEVLHHFTLLVVVEVVVLDHQLQNLEVVEVEHQRFLNQTKQLMDLCQLLIKHHISGLVQDSVLLMPQVWYLQVLWQTLDQVVVDVEMDIHCRVDMVAMVVQDLSSSHIPPDK